MFKHLLLALAMCTSALAADLTDHILDKGIWKMSEDEILALFNKTDYKRTSENHIFFIPGAIQFAYLPVLDGELTFHRKKLMEIELRLRHDKGAPTEAIFHKDAKDIGKLFGIKHSVKGIVSDTYKFHSWRDDFYNIGFSLPLKLWEGPKDRMYLSIEPLHNKVRQDTEATGRYWTMRGYELKHKVKRTDDGSICINDISPIKQLRTGYCFHASAAQAIVHYGISSWSQEHIASHFKISEQERSYPEEIDEGIKHFEKNIANFDLAVIQDYEPTRQATAEPYNKLAKKMNAFPMHRDESYHYVEPDLLRKIRLKNRSDQKDWYKQIQKFIKKGYPVLWVCLDDTAPKAESHKRYHGRLICGFNSRKQTILYLDTCLDTQEVQTLHIDDAYACSIATYVFTPGPI